MKPNSFTSASGTGHEETQIANCKLQIANCKFGSGEDPTLWDRVFCGFHFAICNLQFAICNISSWNASSTLVCLWLLFPSGLCDAADYEQKQGNATLRIEAPTVEKDLIEIRLSDSLVIEVIIVGSAGLEVEVPQPLLPVKDWEVKPMAPARRTPLEGEQARWQQAFRVAPVRPGEFNLAMVGIRVRDDGNLPWNDTSFKPVAVRVTTEIANADLSELRDITGPEQLPPEPSWNGIILWTSLAVAVAGSLAWWLERLRRQRRVTALSPGDWALGELGRIEAGPLSVEAEVHVFHTQLSDTLRRYLEIRFHLPAEEQTTAEFLDGMRRSPLLTDEQQLLLRDFLERCDVVKFARVVPPRQEALATAGMARKFFNDTASPG